jgi:large subunit ribosomal protein L5
MAKIKTYIPELITHYNEKVKPLLSEKLNIPNVMMIPKVSKIVINMGIGDAREHSNGLKNAVQEMTLISGQKPVITYAKNAISNFKVREGDPVGVRVTIRRNKMYDFLLRFITVATPRIRDFRGLPSKGFDGRGNYNFGLTEQLVFPEIDYDKIDRIRGMNITIVTTADSDEEAYELLIAMGMPLRKRKSSNETDENEVAA